MRTEFATAADFWEGMVEPDFAECQRDRASLRAALHAASSLFHMHDWVYHTHKAAVQAAFSMVGGVNDRQGTVKFADCLEGRLPAFGHIRNIANTAKHLKRYDPKDQAPASMEILPGPGGYGLGAHGYSDAGSYSGGPRIMFDANGSELAFLPVARSVFNMWTALRNQNVWF
jgi:hypothetical protein